MRATVTISLPEKLKRELDRAAKEEGVNRSDIVRRSIENFIFLRRFDELTAELTAQARAKGIYTEEDVARRLGKSR